MCPSLGCKLGNFCDFSSAKVCFFVSLFFLFIICVCFASFALREALSCGQLFANRDCLTKEIETRSSRRRRKEAKKRPKKPNGRAKFAPKTDTFSLPFERPFRPFVQVATGAQLVHLLQRRPFTPAPNWWHEKAAKQARSSNESPN